MVATQERVGTEQALSDQIGDLSKGTVILMDYPKRVVRVERKRRITIIDMEMRSGREVPVKKDIDVIEVRAVIPGMEIPGFISKATAHKNTGIRRSILGNMASDANDVQWTELWDLRPVGQLDNPPRSAAERSEKNIVFQLYCRSTEGRDESNIRSSPITDMPCKGTVIPKDVVPDALFMTDKDRTAEAVRISKEVELQAEEDAKAKKATDREEAIWRINAEAEARVRAEIKVRAELDAKSPAKKKA